MNLQQHQEFAIEATHKVNGEMLLFIKAYNQNQAKLIAEFEGYSIKNIQEVDEETKKIFTDKGVLPAIVH